MGSITPLLDTLLHQVLGRQLSLEAHARQPIGPTAVPAVIRDSAVEDTAQSSDDSTKSQSTEDGDFAGTLSARSREQVSEADTATSPVHRTNTLLKEAVASSLPNGSSAQLALSDTARVLSEQARLAGRYPLPFHIASGSLIEAPTTDPVPALLLAMPSESPSKLSSSTLSQPTMLLPLAELTPSAAVHDRNASVPSSQEHQDIPVWTPALSSFDSASLDVSQAARQMNQWTAVLSSQDWHSVLSAETMEFMPLSLLPSALITDTLGQDIGAATQRDTLSHHLAEAVKTSGLFHEALLTQWATGNLPLETIEHSARQRQQLLTVLPAAPEFGDAVIRQQLQMMAGQSIHFQSELWAGAMMLMSFRTEPYLSAGGEGNSTERRFPAFADPRRIWTLTLTFELPVLGTVTAGIQWDGELLSVTLSAENEATRSVLSGARESLEQLLNDSDHAGRTVHIDNK